MPHAAHSEIVNAPKDAVWGILVDKIRNPARYTPGMQDVVVEEETDTHVTRRMTFVQGDLVRHVSERITWAVTDTANVIIVELLNDPMYTGTVTNLLLPVDGASVFSMTMAWVPKEGVVDNFNGDTPMQEAVVRVKEIAESA